MAAGKIYRVLSMFTKMLEGGVISKEESAVRFDVNERSIQRDIVDIREYMEKKTLQTGEYNHVVFDRQLCGYKLQRAQTQKMSRSELYAVIKIILDSKAFTKNEADSIVDRLIECCADSDSKADINRIIAEDRYGYIEPYHKTDFVERLWGLAEAVNQHKKMDIVYRRPQNDECINRRIQPISIMFSEYYFYLVAYIDEKDMLPELDTERYPITYRVDKIDSFTVLKKDFMSPYSDYMKSSEFRKRTSFVYGGQLKRVLFKYSGSSIETVIDHIPSAKIISCDNGVYTFSAEAFGNGIYAWLRSQGDAVELL